MPLKANLVSDRNYFGSLFQKVQRQSILFIQISSILTLQKYLIYEILHSLNNENLQLKS